MKNIIVAFFFMIFGFIGFSQNNLWYSTRGLSTDEVAWGVDVDSIGNIYWAVEEKDQWPFWYQNILLFKIDSNAHQVWESPSWGNGTGFNDIGFIVKVKAPNVYIGGRTDSTEIFSGTGDDALAMSYNMNDGGLNWAYNITPNPDYGYQEIDGFFVQPDGIYLTGWTMGQTTDMDFLIQKISLTGQSVWINSYDYNGNRKFDGANGHMAMDNNFIYTAGHINRTNIASFDGDGALVCFKRSNGEEQWNLPWGGSSFDDALGLTMSSDSMLYMVGYTGSFGNGSQVYLNKYSRTGQLKWSRLWGGTGAEVSRSLVTDADSIIYIVGTTNSYGIGAKDIFVIKYDSSGTLIDSLFWGGMYDEVAHDVAMFGNFLYITGETSSYGNGKINGDHKSDGLLLKINGRKMLAPDSAMTPVSQKQIPEGKISVYPNPTSNIINIDIFDSQAAIHELNIIDMLGQIVFQTTICSNRETLNLKLANGVYFYQIKNKSNEIINGKILIQRN